MAGVAIIGDFGGTNARLALSTPGGFEQVIKYECKSFPEGPAGLIRDYCGKTGVKPDHGVFAIAGDSADPARIMFTNGPWAQRPLDFTALGIGKVSTLNDFAAIAYSITQLEEKDTKTILSGTRPFSAATVQSGAGSITASASRIAESDPENRFVVVGPGTGLGVASGLLTKTGQFLVVGGEGSHTSFAPQTQFEFNVMNRIREDHGIHVTNETICCGPGLVKTYNAISALRGAGHVINDPAQVKASLLGVDEGQKEVAKRTMEIFAHTLGAAASSAALTNNARTVLLAGGILPKLGEDFDKEAFAKGLRTNDLGKNNFMQAVPAVLITHDDPGLLGCHAKARLEFAL